jgi:hypothetical protein
MRAIPYVALGLLALLPARLVRADDDDGNNLKVDVVVDLTDDGQKITRPTAAHPAYYYPVVRGYTHSGDVLAGEKPPPPDPDVEHLIAKALAEQGYLLATRTHPPSLVLMFWWGYKAPLFAGPTSGGAGSMNSGAGATPTNAAVAINEALQSGVMGTNVMENGGEMEQLVYGSNHDRNTGAYAQSVRLDTLNQEARVPRYYVIVSALDYAAATQQKKAVVLWTAFISTGLYGHTLDQVLPSLITAGAPKFGRDTDGAQWPMAVVPIVPMGRVEIGAPYVKAYPTQAAAPKGAP